MKENLLVSFSGGETSAYMAQWLWLNCQDRFNMVFVFANTSHENYETIQFIRRCADYFDIKIHCVEAVVHHGIRKANTHKVVNFWEALMEPLLTILRSMKLNHVRSFQNALIIDRNIYTS